jgi:hypothetical protein
MRPVCLPRSFTRWLCRFRVRSPCLTHVWPPFLGTAEPPVARGCMARQRLWRVALLVGLALSLSFVSRVQAATTWTVCASGCDYPSIKAAIAAPTTLNGDTLAIAAGTYTEPGILVHKSLTLQGEDAASTIVQAAATPGTASTRVFSIPSGMTVTLQALTIRHGKVARNGGGGLLNQGTLTLSHSTVSGNSISIVNGRGGGLANTGTLTLTNSIVSGNSASGNSTAGGGGLYNSYNGTLMLTHSTVSGNSADYGGGLFNDGTVTLINSTVSGNSTASYAGGGLYNTGTLTLTNSTVSGNSASSGGGLLNSGGTLTLTNSTVSGNSVSYEGGGLSNYGPLTLTNSTVSGNSAPEGGGLWNEGTLTLTNSLVAKNPLGGDCRQGDYDGSILSHGYNLDSDGSCHLTAPTDCPGVDPLLGPLQENGGSTFTQALLPGSPALDAIPWGTNGCGTTLLSDQRWQARPQALGGPCDIGAYEVEISGQPLSGWVTGLTPQTVLCQNVTTGQAVTLSDHATSWDCEAAGLGVIGGDQVAMRVQGSVNEGATDVGGAVVGMAPTSGGCTNLTTGQAVTFQHMVGATAASCVAAGLVVHPGDGLQMSVHGVAE